MELLLEYEKFLARKNYNIEKLRHTTNKNVQASKKKPGTNFKALAQGVTKDKTKNDYKKELRYYYLGNEQEVLKYESEVDEQVDRHFYDWTYCYAFKNPDAQKKEAEMDIDDAFEQIDSFFKPMPMPNDIQRSRMHTAHQEVLREILEEMKDEDDKIKKFKGGRFEKIEPEEDKEEKIDKKKPDEKSLDPQWIDHGPAPRDLTTLIFNIFLHKINMGLSLESRTIMSANGNHIFVVIRADEGDLKQTAEKTNYTMQLALGLTDLSSLEPCDPFLKPFRKCENKPKEILDLEKDLEEYFSVVEGNIAALLKEEPLDYQFKKGVLGEISRKDLITYREYLKLIKEGYKDFKRHTYKRPHMKGVHLKTMAIKALEEANRLGKEKGGSKLKK